MPGPGAHFFYAMTSGLALNSLSNGRFGPHHILFYTIQAFFGPDMGMFGEFLFNGKLKSYPMLRKMLMSCLKLIHNPYGYGIWAILLASLYSKLSKVLVSGLFSVFGWRCFKLYSQVPLTCTQCWLLGTAGGFSHFFLDNLFEDNSSELKWVMSTGDRNKQVYTDSVLAVIFILSFMFASFFWFFRSGPTPPAPRSDSLSTRTRSLFTPLRALVASMAGLRCAPSCGICSEIGRIWTNLKSSMHEATGRMSLVLSGVAFCYAVFLHYYKVYCHRSGIGEEADEGVIGFMAFYFVLPHLLCILAMHEH